MLDMTGLQQAMGLCVWRWASITLDKSHVTYCISLTYHYLSAFCTYTVDEGSRRLLKCLRELFSCQLAFTSKSNSERYFYSVNTVHN